MVFRSAPGFLIHAWDRVAVFLGALGKFFFTRNLGKSLLIDMGPEKDKTLLLVLLVTLPAGGACCPMEKREKKED